MHVTCVFSTIGVQNVQNEIRNDRWSVTTITSKKAEHMERPQKTERCRDELMPWLIYLAFIWQLFYGDLDYN